MKTKNVFYFFGLWAYPIGLIGAIALYYLYCSYSGLTFSIDRSSYVYLLLGGLSAPGLITLTNLGDFLLKGKKDFTADLTGNKSVTSISESKTKAMYPPIPDKLLSDKAEGFVIGQYTKGGKKKYVRFPVTRSDIVATTIIGSPGSGKSATLLETLIPNYMEKDPPLTVFALDIKPELARKSIKRSDNCNVKVVDFTDRNSCGWDVYAAIPANATEDEKVRVFDGISRAIITSSNPKDSFFVNNGRTILKGLMLYHYNRGDGFIDSISEITSGDISEQITEALSDVENCPVGSVAYSYLKKFAGKDTDAMNDIILTINEHTSIFLNNTVKWHLRDNPRKASPADLNRGTSVFVCIPIYLLDEFSDLLTLISYQVCSAMECRGEDWEKPVLIILDELARLSKLENLKSLLAVGRSSGAATVMAYQDVSQIEAIYGKEDARTLLNLSELTLVLSCKDTETTKMISDIVGEYREEKVSHGRSALLQHSDGRQQVSEEYRKILDPSDFQDLRDKQEIIAIVTGRYYRVKQLRYYQDPRVLKRYEEIMKENK